MNASDRILKTYLGISARTDEQAVLRLLVDLGRQYARADEGSLLVLDRKTNELVFAMTSGSRQSEKTLLGQRVPVGRGLTGLAAATGEVQIGAPTFKGIRQRKRKGGSGGQPAFVLAAPMLVRNQLIGVLTATTFNPDQRFTQDHATFYAKIAAVAGVVVDQQQRLNTLKQLAEGRRPKRPPTREQKLQMQISESVERLAAERPGQLERVQALLSAIEALCRESHQ